MSEPVKEDPIYICCLFGFRGVGLHSGTGEQIRILRTMNESGLTNFIGPDIVTQIELHLYERLYGSPES